MTGSPLISCIMATARRPGFVRQALRCFARQTYPNRELIVVDDGERAVKGLCRGVPGVRYLRLTRPTLLGTKLNLGIEAARGNILQKIDDDDFYHAGFLDSSVRALPDERRDRTLVTRCCFLVLLRGDPSLRHSGHGWKPGGTFCFSREMWERWPFRDVPRSVDSWFLHDHAPRVVRVCRVEDYILVRHGGNTWNAMTTGDANDYFRARPAYERSLRDVIEPEDRRFYGWLAGGVGAESELTQRVNSSIEIFQAPRP